MSDSKEIETIPEAGVALTEDNSTDEVGETHQSGDEADKHDSKNVILEPGQENVVPEVQQGDVKPETGRDTLIGSVYSKTFPSKQGVKDEYRKIHYVDLPAGTILFRGERIPDVDESELNFYRDFLGSIVTEGEYCLPPTYNVFFYPFPYIPFGVNGFGARFNAIQMYVTRKKVTLACFVGPSTQVRGTPKGFDLDMPVVRCNALVEKNNFILCGMTPEKQKSKVKQMAYDNCVNPMVTTDIPINGWMAIAEKDSIDDFEDEKKYKSTPKNTSLAKYVSKFGSRMQSKLPEVLSWMYTDQNKHRGFPEIAMHPLTSYPKDKNIITKAATVEEALDYIKQNSGNFVYLPLACFTKSQTLDGIESDYKVRNISEGDRKKWSRLKKWEANTTEKKKEIKVADTMRQEVRKGVEEQINNYMNNAMTNGIDIPGVGLSKIVYDSRTGFYVLDSFIRKKDPIIIDITKPKDQDGNHPTLDYMDLLMPLETARQREIAMHYNIVFSYVNPDKLFRPELLYSPDGPSMYRAFIFNRPPQYDKLFKNVGYKYPTEKIFANALKRVTFKREQNEINRKQKQKQKGGFFQKGFGATLKKNTSVKRKGRFRKTRKLRRSEEQVNEGIGALQSALTI